MKSFKVPESGSIHDLIQKSFAIDLPIGSGTGLSIDDPITMNVDSEYVSNEFEVLDFLGYLRSVKWERQKQELIEYNHKYIDRITINVTDLMDTKRNYWTEEHFF
jgi:hypothetical protein